MLLFDLANWIANTSDIFQYCQILQDKFAHLKSSFTHIAVHCVQNETETTTILEKFLQQKNTPTALKQKKYLTFSFQFNLFHLI
jgi:hypothetical protein